MRILVRTLLGVGVVAAAIVGLGQVSGGDAPAAGCPAMGCPALQQVHGDAIAPDQGRGDDGDLRQNPHRGVTPGVCPYSGKSAVSDVNRV